MNGNSQKTFHESAAKNKAHLHTTKPVSYTHLRAHETVLDLVCRLLLEKKKKINTQLVNQVKLYS